MNNAGRHNHTKDAHGGAADAPDYAVLHGLEPERRTRLLAGLARHPVRAGEIVVREGDPTRLLLVESGSYSVWKGRPGTREAVPIATLHAGDCFGERSTLIGGGHATATLEAIDDGMLLELGLAELNDAAVREAITLNLVRTLAGRLLTANHAAKARFQERTRALELLGAASEFGVRMTLWLSIYILTVPVWLWLAPLVPTDGLISALIVATFFWVAWDFVRRAPDGADAYGMSLAGWPRKLGRAMVFTLPWMVLALAAKAVAAARSPDVALFEPWRAVHSKPAALDVAWWGYLAIYVVLTLAQEYVRCAIQGSMAIYQRATGRPDRWRSILVGNLTYAATHLHLGLTMPLVVFLPGLFWSWLYHRDRSYLEVAVSHALLGAWGLFVLGVPRPA